MRARAEDLDDQALAAVLDDIRSGLPLPDGARFVGGPPLRPVEPGGAASLRTWFAWDEIQHYLAEAARRLDPRTRTS